MSRVGNRLGLTNRAPRVRSASPRASARRIEFTHEFAEQLIATAQVIIKVLDPQGRIVRFNPYMEEISGYRMQEMEGHDWFTTFLPAHEQDQLQAIFARCVRGEEVGPFASTMVTKTGLLRAIDWRASALRDVCGGVVGVLSIGKDITQRVQAERELYELNKLSQQRERLADVGAIAAQIVHDVGNPLASLSMQAQLIRRRARESPDQAVGSVLKSAEQMVVELRRLESLVREFMNFAREQRLDLRHIDVPHFLTEIAGLWHRVAFARGINLILSAPRRPLRLCADEEKLHRVCDNLIKNAVEAIGKGPGRITITARPCSGAKVKISVADSGPGIARNVEVFRLFESTKVDGSGLGLAVARQIVLAHGGAIYFDAVKPHGAVFHVELPLQGPAMVKAAATLSGLKHS